MKVIKWSFFIYICDAKVLFASLKDHHYNILAAYITDFRWNASSRVQREKEKKQ